MFGLANPHCLFEQACRRFPDRSEPEVVQLVCEELLGEAEAEPPIPAERLASLRGIAEITRVDQPWAGMLYRQGASLKVTVRSKDPYERQRFTVCHETGHTLYPDFADAVRYRCNGDTTRLEQLCDLAASEFLLPAKYFRGDLHEIGFGLEGTEQLANWYEASIEATARRAVDFAVGPAALLVLSERHKPSERGRETVCPPRLRLNYAYTKGSWPYMRRHKSVADRTPFARALEGELIFEPGDLDELATEHVSVTIDARRYGGRVLALVQPSRRCAKASP